MQQFIHLERLGVIFAETGFNFDAKRILPNGITEEMNLKFSTMDRDGKPTRVEQIQGGAPGAGNAVTIVPLTRYASPDIAASLVGALSNDIDAASDGDQDARIRFGFHLAFIAAAGLQGRSAKGNPLKFLCGPVAGLIEDFFINKTAPFAGEEFAVAADHALGRESADLRKDLAPAVLELAAKYHFLDSLDAPKGKALTAAQALALDHSV